MMNAKKTHPRILPICLIGFVFLLSLSSCVKKSRIIIPELEIKSDAIVGTSPLWDPSRNVLYWVDITGRTLYEYNPQTKGSREWVFNKQVTAVILESDTTVMLALDTELVRFNIPQKSIKVLAVLDNPQGDRRFNQGSCGPEGYFWVGSMALDMEKGKGALYCLSKKGSFEKILQGVTVSNGIVWSSGNNFMYYNDSPTRRIQRYRYYQQTGDILLDGNAVKIKKGRGLPSGMTADLKGNLWVAHWGGFSVCCYNPYTGELLAKVELPVPNVTSCVFGGEDMETLYITTARAGLSEEELELYPLSGSVFSCKVGAQGRRPNYFGRDNRN